MKFAILSTLFFSLAVSAAEISDIDVRGFVDRSISCFGPQIETTADRDQLSECQNYINDSLKNLRNGYFFNAIEEARKINALRGNSSNVLISTAIAIGQAQRKLISIIAKQSFEQQRLDISYLAADSIRSNLKCDYDRELSSSIFTGVIREGLKQKNYNLVIRAAHNRGYYSRYPEDTSWNRIIRELLNLPQMPQLDGLTLTYLKPQWKGTLANEIGEYARPIFEILEKRNWNFPDYEIVFYAYPGNGKIYWKVEGIRGPNFYMGFSLEQERLDWYTNDTAGLKTVVIPKIGAEFPDSDSDPKVYSYTGSDWQNDKYKFLKGPYLWTGPNWEKIQVNYSANNSPGSISYWKLLPELSNYFKDVALPEIRKINDSLDAVE